MIVDELKKSILYYAFSGKLIDNNYNVDVESILNSKSEKDWEYSTKQKIKIREIEKSEELFDLPKNWKWVRLHQVCSYIQRGKSPKYSNIKKIPVIAQKCNQWDKLYMDKCLFINPDELQKYTKERFIINNDILINSTGGGSCGRVGIYDENINSYEIAVVDSHITVCRPYKDIILPKFIYYYLSSPMVQSVIESQAVGTTNQIELMIDTVRNYLIPFTDINHQKKIVEKIEELFAKLDEVKSIEDELRMIKESFPNEMKKSILFKLFKENEDRLKEKLSTILSFSNIKNSEHGENKYLEVKYLRGNIEPKILNKGKYVTKGTLSILVDGENSGEIFKISENGYLGSTLKPLCLSKKILEKYLMYYLMLKKDYFKSNKRGSAIPHLDKNLFFNSMIYLPPIEDQQRIVDKLEKLLPLCDDIEKLINIGDN